MKKLHRVFELTVAQQRVIVGLLLLYVAYAVCAIYLRSSATAPPPVQPSPSPGILP